MILFCHIFTLCVSLFLPLSPPLSHQGYFIIPIAVFAILSSLFLVVLPILQKPRPTLLALSATFIGIPFYIFLVMETPRKLRPAFLDRISSKFKPNVYVCLLLCQVFAVCTFCLARILLFTLSRTGIFYCFLIRPWVTQKII